MNIEKLTVEEWVEFTKKELERFAKDWKSNPPETHPRTMPLGEWEEHFSMFPYQL